MNVIMLFFGAVCCKSETEIGAKRHKKTLLLETQTKVKKAVTEIDVRL